MTHGPIGRCVAVALGATAALLGLVAVAWPSAALLLGSGAGTFDDLLVGGCSVAALGAGGWLWTGTVLTAADAARGARRPVERRGVPRAVRGVVLVACGVALVGAAAPAVAAERAAPPRSPETAAVPAASVAQAASTAAWVAEALTPAPSATVVVRPGDTLWALAAGTLPRGAEDRQVATQWRRLHDLNRGVIGDDPDLIHPGQRLRLPPAPQEGAL